MAVSGHGSIYGGAEGLRHHLCVSHGEHRDEGTPAGELEDLHEDEHPYGGAHRGEWGCYEHSPEDEPTEFHDMYESGGIGEIHRGIGVSLPDRVHKIVHDPSRPVHERAQALLSHVSDHPGHLGMHWTTENRVAEDFAERSARHEANEDQRGRYALDDFTWGHEQRYKDTPLGKPGTAVVFHAHEPSLDVIENDGHRLSNGGAYGWSAHGEREVPIRDTQSLDLKGISWAPMHSDEEVPGHGEYTHHDFGHEHTASAQAQRMSVEDLLGLHSNEALRRKQHFSGDGFAGHGDDTRVSTVYDRKAAEMAKNPGAWGELDEPIRTGSIDPVLLETSSGGHTVVSEGQHRIVRAHQLGVTHLPVSYDPGSQAHRYDWDEPEPLDEHTAAALPGQDENGEWFYGAQPAHTAELPPEMHRGVGMYLPRDLHDHLRDESVPAADRAHALLSHMDEHSARQAKYGDGGLGIHWSGKESSALGFATRYDQQNHPWQDFVHDPRVTRVVLHAQTADPSQMLRSKRKLDEHEIFGINHGEGEIPLKKRSRVHLNGISWGVNEKDAPLTRHDFPQQIRRTAGVHSAPEPGEDLLFHFAALDENDNYDHSVPPAERTESVRHMLDHYQPTDFGTWDEVRHNTRWEHPDVRAFVDDVRRNGVQRPIPVDYESDPPRVMNGHTRLLAAEKAGRETVPTRQHEGFMDPDDPDHLGRQPGDPGHWSNHEGSLKESAGARDETSSDYKVSSQSSLNGLIGHFEAAADMIDLYHHTSPEIAAKVYREKRMTSKENTGSVFFTTDPASEYAAGFGEGVVHVRMPRAHLDRLDDAGKAWQDDEFPSGEQHWAIHHSGLRPEHFVDPGVGSRQAASPEEYGQPHRPDPEGPPLHDLSEGEMMPRDFYERMHEYNIYSHDNGLLGEAAYQAQRKIRLFRGKPDKLVTIWRSAPAVNPESRNAKRGEINNGDWVGLSRHKALAESYEVNDPPHGSLPANHPQRYHIWSARVPARHVRNPDGDMTEWGYFGPDVKDIPHSSATCSHRARVKPKEAAMQHEAAGETAPEGHQVWAVPAEGRSPAGEEVYRNMTAREPGDEHGSAWYQGISYHGPYHVIRHPQTRQVWVVDRHGRDASATGGHYGNPERDGNWGEHQAWAHQHGLESAGPEAHRFGPPGEPRLNLMNERVPEFPHSRTDPEDEERVRRPEPRVHAPEGYSPDDEYHGSYEVVRHPDTGRFHVVDNAGRHAHTGNPRGFEGQLQAERSRDYTEKRQKSKEIGRGIADSIYGKGMDVLDPGGTPESRQSEENMRTASEMMDRYHGGLGEIKFDSDEEGGAPYYEREHLHGNGTPSGWYAKTYGGPSAHIYHRATGDEEHQTIHLPQHPEDENISMTPRLHPDFGDEHLAGALREWHDDPEGREREYLEANNPRISRWKQRRLGAAYPVVAHFEDDSLHLPDGSALAEGRECPGCGQHVSKYKGTWWNGDDTPHDCDDFAGDPEPRPFTAAAAPGGGEEYAPKPEFRAAPEHLSDDEKMEHWEGERQKKHAWESHIRRGLALGHLDYGRARELGYWGDGSEYPEELYDHDGNRVVHRGWQPLPEHLYHVTTDMPSVRRHGLKTRRELGQLHGKGLGAGPDDTISLTSDHATAENILRAVHEHHDVATGKKTPAQMIEEARAGHGAGRPFLHELALYHGENWNEGEPLPQRLDAKVRGVELKQGGYLHTPQEMTEQEGPGWRPHPDSDAVSAPKGTLYNRWERDASPERRREHASSLYRDFAVARAHAGGPEDPLFTSTDVHGFAALDPSRFGIVHVRPRPGAQGFPVSALSEWRTATGDALEVHRAQHLEGGHLKEAAVSLASLFQPGLPNPHTGGDEWFHGTRSQPGDFVHGFSHDDSPSHEEEEMRGHLSHWNTLLGSHFAADHGVAEHFARQGASTGDDDEDDWGGDQPGSRYQAQDPQSVIHARLHLRNPKVYASEFDMDHEAYEHEYGERKNYISKHFGEGYEDEDPHSGDYDPDTPGDFEEWPLAARYRHDDEQPIPREQKDRRTLFSNPDTPEMPERTRWLTSHPDKAGIARRFRERLESRGHDGILYGNEFEGGHVTGHGDHGSLSAIVFRPEQAEITQHHPCEGRCLSPGEAEYQRARMPQPGQEELPGVEEHADRFPNGFLRGHAVVAHFENAPEPAGKTAAPVYMQQKLFHQQPDPSLNAPESGRHNPADPLAHVRHRQETEEGYVPPEQTWDHPEYGNRDEERELYRHPVRGWHCHACTQNQGEPVFHDSADEAEEHNTSYTDWDQEYPRIPATVHRGMRLDDDGSYGRQHLHMLRDAPAAEHTAREVLGHFGDFGTHWTGDEDQARHYAGIGGTGNHRAGGDTLNVVVHARKPAREDIETDPETLHGQNVFGMGYHDDEEIPLREGAPVHVTGVSWKFHDEPHAAWRRHDFGEHAEHTAAVEPGRKNLADVGSSMLAYDKDLSPGDRAFIQSAIDHIRRGAPPSEPIDAGDAEHMARGMRTRDRMEQAGWQLAPGQDKIRYPRGFTVNVGEHHRATLSPNSPSGWHVRTHPADYGSAAGHLHHDLDVRDEDLPSELHRYYSSPQIRGELAAQQGEVIAEGRHEAATTAHFGDDGQQHLGATNWSQSYEKLPGEVHRGLYAPQSHDVFTAPMSDEDIAHGLIAAHQQEHFPYERNQHELFGTHWSTSESVARDFAYEHERGHHDEECEAGGHAEHSEATPVVFHAQRPERHEIEDDPRRLGWQNVNDYDHPEQEVTIKHGSPVRVTGVSWLKHTGLGPLWHRHDLREPVRLRAEDRDSPDDPNDWNDGDDHPSVQHHAAREVVAHFEEGPLPEYHGEPLYHGTRSVLDPGEHLTVEDARSHPNNPDIQTDPYVHATTDPREAHEWGGRASSAQAQRRMEEIGRGRRISPGQNTDYHYPPRVYEVHPAGHVEPDLEYADTEHSSWRSAAPMRVGREVRPLACYDCPDTGRSEEHWPDHPHYEYLRQQEDEDEADRAERGHTAAVGGIPQAGEETWRHLQEDHGVNGDRMPGTDFMNSLHSRFHSGQVADHRRVQHQHENQGGRPAGSQSAKDSISRMFTPIPAGELEAQRRAREPKPERLDDREYSVRDVSSHYDWEGFDPYEISHLVHHPEKATFTREDVPVKSLRLAGENGSLEPPHSYADIAGQDDDEHERLRELERGYDDDAPVPPIVTVRDGEHHIIADGSHRAAIYARQGRTHIPAFVTRRTIFPGQHTAAYDWETDEGPYTWDEIARRHPRVYGDDEDHEPGMGEGGGEAIADAAAELYHDRPSHPYSETTGELHPSSGSPEADIEFHPRTVDVNRIDYMRVGRGEQDPRVERARRGFQDHRQREKIPPLVLVHRHGIYQVADGHHRANGAAQAGWPSVRAYVAYSPHEDEPFAGHDGGPPRKGPFHGAETRDRPPMTDHNGDPARRISFPGFPHTTERPRPQAREASLHVPGRGLVQLDTARDTVLAGGMLEPVIRAVHLLGSWEPQSPAEAAAVVRGFTEAVAALREGVRRAALLLEDMPLHPEVTEAVYEVARSLGNAAARCGELAQGLPPEASWQESGSPNR